MLGPFVVLQGEGVEGSVFDAELKAVEKTFFESHGTFFMARHGFVAFDFAESSVSVHDECDMFRDMSLF